MKTIKVIDLLNMIAKGEKVPKKIKYDYQIFELINNNYYMDSVEDSLTDYIAYDFSNLNDEVEILEDEEQEIDKEAIEKLNFSDFGFQLAKIFKEFKKGYLEGLKD